MTDARTPHVVVVGSGAAGLVASKVLVDAGARVTLVERESRLGGHAMTYTDAMAGPVDLGFMVCNRPTYPNFFRFFEELGVDIVASDMSLAIFDQKAGTSWSFQGGRFGWAVRNLWRPRLWGFAKSYKALTAVSLPFLKECQGDSEEAAAARQRTMAEVCNELDPVFVTQWLYPMVSAVWSAADPASAAACPILSFLRNHRLLWPNCGGLKWQTPRHGSKDYVNRLVEQAVGKGMEVMTGCEVVDVDSKNHKISVRQETGEEVTLAFDKVVLAGHATDSQQYEGLQKQQKQWLKHFKTSVNDVALWVGKEAGEAYMPRDKNDWASWNCPSTTGDSCKVTYWLSRLQNLDDPNVFVTLNAAPSNLTGPPRVRYSMRHPVMDLEAYAGQRCEREAQGLDGVYFAGAWLRNGFHEDAAVTGILAARRALQRSDLRLEFVTEEPGLTDPKAVKGTAYHAATKGPTFAEAQYFYRWDAREPPAGYDRGDYCLPSEGLDEPLDTTLRKQFAERLDGWWPAGKIEVIGHIRHLGCGFNSFVLYIARGDPVDGCGEAPHAVMVEVHNVPWGESTLYAMRLKQGGGDEWTCEPATVPKSMHVSPFHPPPADEEQTYTFRVVGFAKEGAAGEVSIALGGKDGTKYTARLQTEADVPDQAAHDVKYGAWRSVVKIYGRAAGAALKRPFHPYSGGSAAGADRHANLVEGVAAGLGYGVAGLTEFGAVDGRLSAGVVYLLLAATLTAFHLDGCQNALLMVAAGAIAFVAVVLACMGPLAWGGLVLFAVAAHLRVHAPAPASVDRRRLRALALAITYTSAGYSMVAPRLPDSFVTWVPRNALMFAIVNLFTDGGSEVVGLMNALALTAHALGHAAGGTLLPSGGSPLVFEQEIFGDVPSVCSIFVGYLVFHGLTELCIGGQGMTRALLAHHVVFCAAAMVNLAFEINAPMFPGLALLEASTVALSATYFCPGAATQLVFLLIFFLVRICYFPIYILSVGGWWFSFFTGTEAVFNLVTMLGLLSPAISCCGLVLNFYWFKALFMKHFLPGVFSSLSGVEWRKASSKRKQTDTFPVRGTPVVDTKVSVSDLALRAVLRGELELGESYVRGEWTPAFVEGEDEDLYLVLRKLAEKAGGADGSKVVSRVLDAIRWLNPSMKQRSKTFQNSFGLEDQQSSAQSIQVHYDDESEVIRSFLDEGQVYTAAKWHHLVDPGAPSPMSLDEAQVVKIDRLLDLGEVGPGTRVLDIGCGWGFLCKKAMERGARVMGVCNCKDMIQRATKAHVSNGNEAQMLSFRVCDFRDLPLLDSPLPEVDVITTVEMIEAVKARQYEDFARACWRCLKPGGKVVMQAIHARPYNNVTAEKIDPDLMGTFVTTHIFPGQQIPNLDWLFAAFSRAGFRRAYMESNGHNYARTLAEWARRLESGKEKFSEATVRKYRYYLAFCRAGFDAELLDLADMVWVKA